MNPKRALNHLRALQRLLDEGITLDAIAEDLHHVPAEADAAAVKADLDARRFDTCGVSVAGRVTHLVRARCLTTGRAGDHAEAIPPGQCLPADNALWKSFGAVIEHGAVFVEADGKINGIVTVADLDKQPSRLLMFGVISMLEMVLMLLIRQEYNEGDGWLCHIGEDRAAEASKLHAARTRVGQQLDLLSCTQLCDKITICEKTLSVLEAIGVSKNRLGKVGGRLTKVRNNLAHGHAINQGIRWTKVVNALGGGRDIVERVVPLLAPTPGPILIATNEEPVPA